MKDFHERGDLEQEGTQLDPKNKEAYYTLGVIPWTEFIVADRDGPNSEKMRPEDPGPLKDPKDKAELKAKYWQRLTDGIEDEKKALADRSGI